jgi:hypothetical protein
MYTRSGINRTLALLTLLLFTSAALAGGKNETAVTVWLVIFNNPAGCVEDLPPHDPGDCTEYDIFYNEDAMAGVCYLGGQSVQANRRITLSGRFAEGTLNGCLWPMGLMDADKAEIHSVLQQHGWSLESGDGLEEQIGEILGNCNPTAATGPEPENFGSCVDSQFTIHQPTGASVTVSDVYRFTDISMVENANTMLTREADGIRFSWHTRLDEEE